MAPKGKYTAADLARLAAVSLRTVRFYIQEGLVDPPLGRGPGAHFDDRHLRQLRRTRALQGAGLDLPAIRDHANELEQILAERGLTAESAGRIWTSFALSTVGFTSGEEGEAQDDSDNDDDDAETVDADSAIRIPLAPGVELLVAPDIALPSPRRLVDLAFAVRRLFKLGKETK
ncbi:MAG TPA: MerR family transcriptional regulator [Caulobacteraceae bacterium]|jgi:DNA-binding transcriptional MerR regulator|nr:MerR family transcriptional regulator [Caulobacteraceae bacterium]